MSEPILAVQGLKKYFPYRGGKSVKAVDGIDLEIRPYETLGLVGESGSGKSTVAYTVVGMYKPTSGRILFGDRDISVDYKKRDLDTKGDIQIVFQDPGSSLNPRRNILQTLQFPMNLHAARRKPDFPDSPERLVEEVGLSADCLYRYSRSMSGGERQLLAIARALATQPRLMILDEPTSALDVSVQAKVINRLIDLQGKFGLAYLFITHDLSLMRNVAHRVSIMYLGKICENATTSEFFSRPLHPYTQMLLASIPVATQEEENLKPKKIPPRGEIPSPVDIPPGCSFHLRCPLASERCRREDPVMKLVGDEHWVRCHLC